MHVVLYYMCIQQSPAYVEPSTVVPSTGRSLLWVGALGFVVLYIYAVIAYAGYQNYFENPDSSGHCRTLFQCSVSVIRLGLLGGALLTVRLVVLHTYHIHQVNLTCTTVER